MTSSASSVREQRRWGLQLVLAGNVLLDALEVSVVFVALPRVGSALDLTLPAVQWLVSGFALGFGGTLLFGNRAVARFGRRRVYLVALLIFAVASLVGGTAGSGAVLVAVRVIKGACAALTAPTGLAIIAVTFGEGPPRNRAVAIYSLFAASGFSLGLLLAGVLTQVDWRWTFLFPAPAALLLFAFSLYVLPSDQTVPAAETGGRVPAPAAARLAGLVARRTFLRSSLGAAGLNGSYWGFLFIGTFYLQSVLHWTTLQTALAFLPGSALLAVSTPLSGRLVQRFGAARLIAVGAAGPPLGYALLIRLRVPAAYVPDVLPSVLLVGIGYVFCFSALHVQAMAGIPAERQSLTTCLYQAVVQVGGAAVLTSVAVTMLVGRAGAADAPADVVLSGSRPALVLITVVGALGLVTALAGALRRRRGAPDPAEAGS